MPTDNAKPMAITKRLAPTATERNVFTATDPVTNTADAMTAQWRAIFTPTHQADRITNAKVPVMAVYR